MKIFKTRKGILLDNQNVFYLIKTYWDSFINNDHIY
jgi:hypothetical protein